jgi:hypothetical protein
LLQLPELNDVLHPPFTEIARASCLPGCRHAGALRRWSGITGITHAGVVDLSEGLPRIRPLRAEPRFQALLAHAREHAARQRELLARMRGGDGIAGNVQPTPVGNGNVEQSASY